jgi:V-type H+-transporting ATPase subunit A
MTDLNSFPRDVVDGRRKIDQLVGKSDLVENDKITLEVSRLIKDDFLQLNGYSDRHYKCPMVKPTWKLKGRVRYYNLVQ